eukprot:TRINITY_DN8886_c0_g1_i1.p1 TRINITY_DN8886_c0_g1~~TRINITY_DN8886_c0_g1_i1.p1  ORF type:complete len:420 (+),score=117.05 TRINITY_DN8886_c0_g1_i1:30-1289(+)
MITRFTQAAKRGPVGQSPSNFKKTLPPPPRRHTHNPPPPPPSSDPSPIPPEELQQRLKEILERSNQDTANKLFRVLDPVVEEMKENLQKIEKSLEGSGYTMKDVKKEFKAMARSKAAKRHQRRLRMKKMLRDAMKEMEAKEGAAPDAAGGAQGSAAKSVASQSGKEKKEADTVDMFISRNLRSLLLNNSSKEFSSSVGEKIMLWKSSLSALPPGELRAVYLQNEIDNSLQMVLENEKGKGKEITCKKGCAFCCHRMVDITSDEAFLLTNKLEEMEGGTISNKTIAELTMKANQFPSTIKGDKFQWKADYEVSKCIFLKNSECSVYQQRPVTCRLMNVVSDPQLCSKEATNPQDKSTRLISLLPEIIHSAAIDLDENHGAMPQALLAEIERRKQSPTTSDQQIQAMADYIDQTTTFKSVD